MKHTSAVKLVERFGGVVGQDVGRGTGRYSAVIPSTGFRVAWSVAFKGNLTGHGCSRDDDAVKVVDGGRSFPRRLAPALWRIALGRNGDEQVKVENWYEGSALRRRVLKVSIEQIGRDQEGREQRTRQQEVLSSGPKRKQREQLAGRFLDEREPRPLLDWIKENAVCESEDTLLL